MRRWKFEDCPSCINRRRRDICAGCDVGEFYEDEEAAGVDAIFRETPTRFGERVIADDADPALAEPLDVPTSETDDDEDA